MWRKSFWFKVLVVTNVVTLICFGYIVIHDKVPQRLLIKLGVIENYIVSTYDIRTSLFKEYYPKKYRIVMLGDSITQGVEWNELMGAVDIANRGIGGDTTEGFLKRLSNVYSLEPEMCFIMGGINDIGLGISVEKIQGNMNEIINGLMEHGIQPIIQSTLYVSKNNPKWQSHNKKVDEVNNWLKETCQEKALIYVDINKELSLNGVLKEEYTYDGVHLYGSGYKEWSKLINPIVENK